MQWLGGDHKAPQPLDSTHLPVPGSISVQYFTGFRGSVMDKFVSRNQRIG